MAKPRILAVDDEESFMDLFKQYFEPRGYKIEVTSDGIEGLRLVRENEYDVVLLDLKMAGISGDELMKEIKKLDDKVEVIFITAYSDSGKTKERLLNEGAFAFIEKPISSLKTLEEIVNEAAASVQDGG